MFETPPTSPTIWSARLQAESFPNEDLSHLSSEKIEVLRLDLERAVRQICPPWLSAQADDLVQASLMRIVERMRKTSEKQRFNLTYLKRTAFSALVDEIRRVRARGEKSITEEGEDFPLACGDADPEQRLLADQIGQQIRDCLAKLITPRRLAVVLKLQGETAPDSAKILGWTLRKTENLLYRGMADLRQCLTRKGL